MNRTGGVYEKDYKPIFLITIDTEGDNLWARPRTITTRNVDFLPRFQSLCESYRLKPTYLTNFEVAKAPSFIIFGRDILKRETGEIGMHLHAWNNPPLVPLTRDDLWFHPYLVEYPCDVMHKKVTVLTSLLEDVFGVKMVSHRSGRWSFNEIYAQILVEEGYRVDCSVTPHVSWKHDLGDPNQHGGTDFSQFQEETYFLDLTDVSRSGDSPLLEVPMTVVYEWRPLRSFVHNACKNFSLAQKVLNRFLPVCRWLRPNGKNRNELLRIVRQAIYEKRDYVQLMLHSSELMPGGSPTFAKHNDIEKLYEDLEVIFSAVKGTFEGATLKEYYQRITREH